MDKALINDLLTQIRVYNNARMVFIKHALLETSDKINTSFDINEMYNMTTAVRPGCGLDWIYSG